MLKKNLPFLCHLPRTFLSLFLTSYFSGQIDLLAGENISSLIQDKPKILNQFLGASSYAAVKTKKLKAPKLIWLNTRILEEKGISSAVLSSDALKQEVLNQWAYSVPEVGEEALFAQEAKTFYADRYGGFGIGENFGSGRAASAGSIQIKGIGKTDLVGNKNLENTHGFASLDEGIKEVIFGEISQELPWKGNRVLALIDRGTFHKNSDGILCRDVLIIREDALRPAHYIQNMRNSSPYAYASDAERISEALVYLPKTFLNFKMAEAKQDLGPADLLMSGLKEFTKRVAEQYAAAFAHKLYHGGTSASNIRIDGGFLDYGTMTAQPGYGKIQVLLQTEPAGSTREIKNDILKIFKTSIERVLNEKDHKINELELFELFDSFYQKSLAKEFLLLTGAPKTLVEKLVQKSEFEKLGLLLHSIAVEGAIEYRQITPGKAVTKYDLNQILVNLAEADPENLSSLQKKLSKSLPEDLAQNLAKAYQDFMFEVYRLAQIDQIQNTNLKKLILFNAHAKNSLRPKLYGQELEKIKNQINTKNNDSLNFSQIKQQLEHILNENRSFTESKHPYQVILKDLDQSLFQTRITYVFDAAQNQYLLKIRQAENTNSPSIQVENAYFLKEKLKNPLEVLSSAAGVEKTFAFKQALRKIKLSSGPEEVELNLKRIKFVSQINQINCLNRWKMELMEEL